MENSAIYAEIYNSQLIEDAPSQAESSDLASEEVQL
jgi:hypothetical protein